MKRVLSTSVACLVPFSLAAWVYLERDQWIRQTFAPRVYDPFFSLALDALPLGLFFVGAAVAAWALVDRRSAGTAEAPSRRILLALIIAAACTWALRSEGTRTHSWPMIMSDDFPSYYFAAAALRDGLNPYDGQVVNDLARDRLTAEISALHERVNLPPPRRSLSRVVFPYLYPPLCAVVLQPLVGLDYMQAQQVWAVLNIVAFALLIVLAWRYFRKGKWAVIAVFGLVLLYEPLVNNAETGQINLLVALAAWSAFHFDRKDRWLVAGFALAMAIMLKFSPLLLLAYFIARRRWQMVLTTIAISLLLAACTWFVVGSESMNYYRNEVIKNYSFVTKLALPSDLRPEALVLPNNVDSVKAFYDYPGVRVYNQAPMAFAGMVATRYGWTGHSAVRSVQVLLGLMWLPTLWLTFKSRGTDGWRLFAACTVLTLLTSPILWQHHLVWLLFPLLILTANLNNLRDRSFASIAATSFALISLISTGYDFGYSPFGLSEKLTDLATVIPFSYTQLAGTFLLWIALILPTNSRATSSTR